MGSGKGTTVGLNELQALAAQASTLPVNKIWISFLSPTMMYLPGSSTLQYTGLGADTSGDYGYQRLKAYITQLQAGGVDVYLSMGGWNYNCFPYAYTRYSVGGYGTSTPNFWEIEQNCGGSVDNANESNQWCYTCEPQSEGTTSASFAIFPNVPWSPTWTSAEQYVEANAKGGAPSWQHDMIPGQSWTDPKTNLQLTIPGSSDFVTAKRDPYQDLVYLAKDLGVKGVDIDYEEFWHADYFKVGASGGPWTLYQTVYKYVAILKDVYDNINAIYPGCAMSTAAGATGAWQGNWWGGNLKGVWYYANLWFPTLVSFVSSTGGINVMTYDLSSNEQYYECPSTSCCTLECQVDFYMGTYAQAGIPANVGYEVGTPAYPSPVHDLTHQLPLTTTALATITSQTQSKYRGGFFLGDV